MSTTFTVTIKATSITVFPGQESTQLLQPLLNLMMYEDEYVEETKTLGYILDSDTDILYLHKGVDLNYLKRLLGDVEFINDPYDAFDEMEFEYEEIIPPRNDEQVDVINFIAGLNHHSSNVDKRQLFLVKDPGFGKTYCSGVGLCKFKVKTLIIMHRDSLRRQWLNSLYNMSGLSDRYVHEIVDSEELYEIAHNRHDFDYDVYLMTHATFRAGLKRIGNLKDASNIAKNLKIGFKIIDEVHLEFRSTLLIDSLFNVCRNLYLTATDGRSSKDENAIFKHVFCNAEYYKPSVLLTANIPKKWVEYTIVEINTHCKPNIYRYKVAGGRGMNPASYGKWVIAYDKKQTHFKVCRELLKIIYERDDKAKVLLFMPLIDLCEDVAYFLTMGLNYDESFPYDLNIKTINSNNTKAENERNKRADVIVTTISSCGTGTDIPGITDIISCSPFVSKITAQQVFGRIRYCGKICHYYDIYDTSVQLDKFWIKSRSKKMKEMALKTNYISWTDDEVTDKE
jgi:superfamily II DNA or RNA helicase